MAITFPRDFPTFNGNSIIEKMTIRQVSAVAIQQSPYTYTQQVHDYGGHRWEAEVTIRPLTHTEALVFQAFLISLQGQKNTFKLGNPLSVSDNNDNYLIVNGSHDKGDNTVSFQIQSPRTVDEGMFFSINDRLYMFLEGFSTNPTTAEISPPLREDLSHGVDAVTNNPVGTWRLSTNEVDWDIDKAGFYSFTFSCIEAI